jgi:hypothetical protein
MRRYSASWSISSILVAYPLPLAERRANQSGKAVAAGCITFEEGRGMSDSDDFTAMSDPDFLAERKRVRETLEALTERYRVINIEFDRRAGVTWTSASRG